MKKIPTRQVHLDFHTSEHLTDIGSHFSKTQWQECLRLGNIGQINLFAKCHHSWSYYPTAVGRMHPNLKFDLLGAQIEACHEIGVVTPIYYTVGWSAHDAEVHPEWCVLERSGMFHAAGPWDHAAKAADEKPWGWKWLCAAAGGPYHAHIMAQVEEICTRYPVDGLWFDIYSDNECHCFSCRSRMAEEGVDMHDRRAVTKSYTAAVKKHTRELEALVHRHHPLATLFFNGLPHPGDTERFRQRLYEINTQQELEDLPTTWGGYDKLPAEAKFHLAQGSQVLAMSGKFHKSWGEFGGFKHADALTYEAAAMIAQGAACNFGDHLHPSGELDLGTYANLGKAYAYVEKIEAYGPGGVPCSNLGVWLSLDDEADRGTVTMLLELHRDFVIADEDDLDTLTALIIPGKACLNDAQAKKIEQWVNRGGSLLLIGEGALDAGRTRFLFDLGADYIGGPQYKKDYTLLKGGLASALSPTPYLNYHAGLRACVTTGTVLAAVREPYFDRTYGTYCGHANTPYRLEDSAYPAVLRHGRITWLAHDIDRQYLKEGLRLHRDLFSLLLKDADPRPILSAEGLPSGARINLLHQKELKRFVVHILYAPVIQRGSVKVIEDFPTIRDVSITLRASPHIKKVRHIPMLNELPFSAGEDGVAVRVPDLTMHTAVIFEY